MAKSVVTRRWESKTQAMHAEFAGVVDRTGAEAHTLHASGFAPEDSRQVLDNMAQSQSVMLATNEIMAFVSLAFFLSALLMWSARRPTRKVAMGPAH